MNRNKVDAISIVGASHIRAEKECQDASVCWQEKNYDAVIVCDGHGGEKYFRSAIGSKLACEVGKEAISTFMQTLEQRKDFGKQFVFGKSAEKRNEMLNQLERNIIQLWYERITSDMKEHPFSDDENFQALSEETIHSLKKSPVKAYGSTFLAAILSNEFYILLKLGDGNIVLADKLGRAKLAEEYHPELVDEQLEFNLTTSLCNSDADMQFKHAFHRMSETREISSVILSTDGIMNSYKSKEAFLDFIENIATGYRAQTRQKAHDELAEFLPRLSEKGSGDDLSVAIICGKKTN